MLTSEDYRQLSNQLAQLAIAASAPNVAEALMAKASELLSTPPTIEKVDVLAAKLPDGRK